MSDTPIPSSDDFEDEEDEGTLSGIEDVPKPLKRWAKGQALRTRNLEKHFEKRGMVHEMHSDWTALKKSVGVFKWLAPMIGAFVVAVVAGIVYLVNHAASQPTPQPAVRAEEIAREVVRMQQK